MYIDFELINESLLEVNQIIERDIESEINKLSVYYSKKVIVTDDKGYKHTGYYAYCKLNDHRSIGGLYVSMILQKVLKNGNAGFHTFSVWNPVKIELV